MSIRYKICAEGVNLTMVIRFTILMLLAIALTTGCASQPRVVEVEVTVPPQVNVVEVTATPAPTPAGRGGLIAFLSDRAASTYELYVMNADGTDPRALAAAGDGFHAGPSWSPDGQRIAYTKVVPDERGILDNHGPFEIWVTTLDGGEHTLLSAGITDEILALPWPTPTWSPDGTRLAFIAAYEADTGDTLSGVYVVAADGGGLEWSYPLPWLAFDVLWSPTGESLLLVGDDEETGSSVRVLSIADQELTEIYQNAQTADWSPDGSEIVVSSVQPPDVIVLEPGGESRVVARIEGKFPFAAKWSPDGRNILVGTSHLSNLTKITALQLVSVSTGDFITIAEYDNKYIYAPNWSPEGDRLLYTTTDLNRRRQGDILHADLWVYDPVSGETQQLTTGEFHDGMGVWSPAVSTRLATPMEITYIDNDSFLIAANGQKVLMDVHRTTMPREVRDLIAQALPPFDDVDLVLVTRAHSDHFDPQLVGAYLEQNPNAVFASTEEAVDNLRSLFLDLEGLQERTKIFEPEKGERMRATLNGIDLDILNIPHGVEITNLGFIVSIGGRKLLHTGDMVDVADLESYELARENIDIALVPYFYLIEDEFWTEDGQSTVLEAIQAEQIVPIHYSPTEWNVESVLEELATRLPESILFHEAMETWIVE